MKKIVVLSWIEKGKKSHLLDNFPNNSADNESLKNVKGFIGTKYYKKVPRPLNIVITQTTENKRLSVLQRKLDHKGEWVAIVHPNVIIPSDFFDIVKNECTNPNVIYGAERICHRTVEDYVNNKLFESIYEQNEEIANGYLQVYWNGSRYGPKNKIYSVKDTDASFKNRWKKIVKLPLFVNYILEV